MVAALRPTSFRLAIESAIKFHKTELEDDKKAFVQELLENVDRYETDLLRERQAHNNHLKRSRSFVPPSQNEKKPRTEIICLKCQSPGHHVRNCPQHPSMEEQQKLIAQCRFMKNNGS